MVAIKGTFVTSIENPFRWEWLNEISIEFGHPLFVGTTLTENGFVLFRDKSNKLYVKRDVLYFNKKLIYASAMDHAGEINKFLDHLKKLMKNELKYISTQVGGQIIDLITSDYKILYKTHFVVIGNKLWDPIDMYKFEEFDEVCSADITTCMLELSDQHILINYESQHIDQNKQIIYEYENDRDEFIELINELEIYHNAIYDCPKLDPIEQYKLYIDARSSK